MTEPVVSWAQTPAALIRNRGLVVDVERARALLDDERRSARAEFDQAWRHDLAMIMQRQLAERGWTGAWVTVGDTIAPELQPLYAGASLAQTRSGIDAPGRRDPLVVEHDRIVRERLDAAEARLGPLARTVG